MSRRAAGEGLRLVLTLLLGAGIIAVWGLVILAALIDWLAP